jgi:hypothetical protein
MHSGRAIAFGEPRRTGSPGRRVALVATRPDSLRYRLVTGVLDPGIGSSSAIEARYGP